MNAQVVSLQLPNDLYDKLQFLSASKRKNPVDIVAQLITTAYDEQQTKASTPAFQDILENAADLGVTDLSEQHDHYLYGVEKQ
jgi:predicted GTPase